MREQSVRINRQWRFCATAFIAVITIGTSLVEMSISCHPRGVQMLMVILPSPKVHHLYTLLATAVVQPIFFEVTDGGRDEPHNYSHDFCFCRYSWHHLLLCLCEYSTQSDPSPAAATWHFCLSLFFLGRDLNSLHGFGESVVLLFVILWHFWTYKRFLLPHH